MSTLGRLKKWLFGNIQFHLWTRRSIFGFGIEQVLFAQELAGIRPLGRSLLALSLLPDNSNIIKRWCEFHSQLSLLTLWNLEILMGPYYILSNFGDGPRPNSTNNLFHEILFNSWKQKLFMMFSIKIYSILASNVFQIKSILLWYFMKIMAKILKPCCILYKRKKKSHRQFDDEKYFGVCPILQ